MKNLIGLAPLVLSVSVSAPLFAQPLPGDVCVDADVQNACAASCAPACADATFFVANTPYCAANALSGGVMGELFDGVVDSDMCTAFEVAEAEPEAPVTVIRGSEGEMSAECAALPSLSQRMACQRVDEVPSCAPNVPRLEANANLVVRSIGEELAQYGDLLERDWTEIDNQALLCEFTLTELDESYVAATEDPQRLERLQDNAREIQSCHAEWEMFARDRATAATSDSLVDSAQRESAERLTVVADTIEDLRGSIEQLRGAADTIVGIVDAHLTFCDNEG